jgi:hypothetical protein
VLQMPRSWASCDYLQRTLSMLPVFGEWSPCT